MKNMYFRFFTLLYCMLFALMVSAQASGGQIRRQSERASSRRNVVNKRQSPRKSPRRNAVKISNPDGHLNGHGYVDLALPSKTKWANCNIGANIPEEAGYYLSWGETGPKSYYDNKKTALYDVAVDDISNNEIYDVALIKWGNGWSIPTKNQWDELIRYCKYKSIERNGIGGLLFIGKNGKSIFFPFGGVKGNEILSFKGLYGFYWSSNADYRLIGNHTSYPDNAYSICYQMYAGGKVHCWASFRGDGYNVRPVTK